ncbi:MULTISPECIES: hypothetical protein [unclassified Kribbella]|uniref:hypothetical protein n=1 Tax=unclassified Kribbella TaxID=2644121 RepID=UPI0033F69215
MVTIRCLAFLLVASVISVQVVILMERGRPMRKRLRDLGWGGDASSLLLVAALMTSAVGAVLGSLFDGALLGAGVGGLVALLVWAVAVAWAHREPQAPPRHRQQ